MAFKIREQRILGKHFSAACNHMFEDPLFNHMTDFGSLEVLIWSDDHAALMEWLVAVASCGCMYDVPLHINLCGREIAHFEEKLRRECPMFDEVFSRRDTADISFAETPEKFPAYVACSETYAVRLPEGQFHVLIREEDVGTELMRLAENLHYVFCISYGSRESLNEMLDKMHKEAYSTASSVAQAAHIPVKLRFAGVREESPEDAAAAYMALIERDRTIMNRLVYLEHTRWTVFQGLCGWRIPTEEEMKDYAFVVQENPDDFIAEFRHKKALLHPSLHACSLKGVDILDGPEGSAYWDGADDSELDDLSKISLWQHHYTSKLAITQRAAALALIQQCRAEKATITPELTHLEDVVKRIQLKGAEFEFQKALNLAKTTLGDILYNRIWMLMQSSIEASRRRSYLQGDIFAIKTMGFVLVFRRRFTRIIRTLSDNVEANITALMRLDPEKIVFITGFDDSRSEAVESELRGGVKTFIQTRSLRAETTFLDCRGDMEAALVEALCEAGKDATLDASGAPADFCFVVGANDVFTVRNGLLKPLRGCKAIEAMNALPRDLLVEDFFAAMGQKAFDGWDVPDIAGIQKLIGAAFHAYIDFTKNESPDSISLYSGDNGLVKKINDIFRWKTFEKADNVEEEELSAELPAEIAINRNVTGCLVRLKEDGLISDFQVKHFEKPSRYKYAVRSCRWIDPEGKLFPLINILLDTQNTDYSCAVKYKDVDKKRKPQLKIIRNSFPTPSGKESALEHFEKAGCFQRTEDGQWAFASAAAKAIFAKEGNILEDYVFAQLMRNPNYRSVALSYSFGRADQISDQEIDVIAVTRNNRPVMFSCKLGGKALEFSAIKEIANHCRIYAMNRPIAVLVSACTDAILKNKKFAEGEKGFSALKAHGVHFIDRKILEDEDRFQAFLNDIAGA